MTGVGKTAHQRRLVAWRITCAGAAKTNIKALLRLTLDSHRQNCDKTIRFSGVTLEPR